MLLENKIAVVTGAGRGIGRGIALALAREGAMVVVNYNGSKERAEEVVRTIEEAGGKAAAIQCNISDFEAAKEFFANVVKEYGKIDILVNNAGITKDNLMMKMSEEEFQSVIQTNLAGTFHGVKFVTRPNDETETGTYYQHCFRIGSDRKYGTGKLFCFQSRSDWSYQGSSERTGIP